MKVWPEARLDSSVIVVPQTIGFEDASATIALTESFETPFVDQQYKSAILYASELPEKLKDVDAERYWHSIEGIRLNVFNDTPMPIGRLTPLELDESFGTNWFLVTQTSAQVMSNLDPEAVSTRCRIIEKGSKRITEVASPSRQAEPPDTIKPSKDQMAKARRELDSNFFHVLSSEGKIAYRCKRGKSDRVSRYLKHTLPTGSYKQTKSGIQLLVDAESLGFKNLTALGHACSIAGRGGVPKLKGPMKTSTAKPTERQSPSSIPRQEVSKKEAKKSVPRISRRMVSFDGPEHVLYVFKGTLSCERRGHNVEGATGSIVTLAGSPVNINVNYCNNCHKYYLGQREYEHYRGRFGPVLGNFSFPESTQSDPDSVSLSKESPLMMCGYNVRESEGLTSRERHLILANMIDRRILSKPRIIDYLQFFISWREGNPSMRNACNKWREDLAFVRDYSMNTQRRFTISTVRRNR